MRNNNILQLSFAGLLIAMGLIIPMFSPIKIILEPASFTLASHVPIFMALFISPFIAVTVAIGTAISFFIAGFPLVVGLRAASHIVFATLGSLYVHKITKNTLSTVRLRVFSFCIALIHALCELIVVFLFYFGGNNSDIHYNEGLFLSILLLVGLGTVIHSIIDFEIARFILLRLKKQKGVEMLFKKC